MSSLYYVCTAGYTCVCIYVSVSYTKQYSTRIEFGRDKMISFLMFTFFIQYLSITQQQQSALLCQAFQPNTQQNFGPLKLTLVATTSRTKSTAKTTTVHASPRSRLCAAVSNQQTDDVLVVEEKEEIPVITFRLCSDDNDNDDNDLCVMIDGDLNKNSKMETVMESQDVINELGIGSPSKLKFMVKRKQPSFILLRWNQLRSMKVRQLARLQNINKNYLVVVNKKQSQHKVHQAKLEDLRKTVLTMSKILDDLTIVSEKKLPVGNYFIKTTHHEPSGQVAGWGLAAWQLYGGKRNGGSSWVATHEGDHWSCKWLVTPGKKPNTYRIKCHDHGLGGQLAGWGLSAWQLHGSQINGGSSRVAVHDGDHWYMDWEIVPGKKDNTWRVLTTHHTDGGQPADWEISSWGSKVGDMGI